VTTYPLYLMSQLYKIHAVWWFMCIHGVNKSDAHWLAVWLNQCN